MSAHPFDYTTTRTWIENAYAAGSWNENSHETAIAVRALSILTKPKLVVKAGASPLPRKSPLRVRA